METATDIHPSTYCVSGLCWVHHVVVSKTDTLSLFPRTQSLEWEMRNLGIVFRCDKGLSQGRPGAGELSSGGPNLGGQGKFLEEGTCGL